MKLLLALLLTLSPALASDRIDQLKNYLGQREQVARIYMPQQATQGEAMQVLIMAPGATSVTVLGSRASSGIESELGLQLGAEPLRLASVKLDESGRANLSLDIPVKPVAPVMFPTKLSKQEKKAAKIAEKKLSKEERKAARLAKRARPEPDIYYLEAVLDYPSGEQRKAMVFGASANYIGFNGVQVLPPFKEGGEAAASMARSFIPGMAGMPVGNY